MDMDRKRLAEIFGLQDEQADSMNVAAESWADKNIGFYNQTSEPAPAPSIPPGQSGAEEQGGPILSPDIKAKWDAEEKERARQEAQGQIVEMPEGYGEPGIVGQTYAGAKATLGLFAEPLAKPLRAITTLARTGSVGRAAKSFLGVPAEVVNPWRERFGAEPIDPRTAEIFGINYAVPPEDMATPTTVGTQALGFEPDPGVKGDLQGLLLSTPEFMVTGKILGAASADIEMLKDWTNVSLSDRPTILAGERGAVEIPGGKTPKGKTPAKLVKEAGRLPKAEPVITSARELLQDALKYEAKGGREGFRAGFKEGEIAATTPQPKSTATLVKEAGQLPPMPLVSERAALIASIKAQARGAREGALFGEKELAANRHTLFEMAKAGLPKEELGRVLPVIDRARTPGELYAAAKAIDNIIGKVDKWEAVAEFKEAQKGLDLTKLRPAERQAATDLLGEVSTTNPTTATIERLASLSEALTRDPGLAIPKTLMSRLRETYAAKPLLRDLTPDEIRELTNGIKEIQWLNNRKQGILAENQSRVRTAIQDQAETDVKMKNPGEAKYAEPKEAPWLKRVGSLLFRNEAHPISKTQAIFGVDSPTQAVVYDATAAADVARMGLRQRYEASVGSAIKALPESGQNALREGASRTIKLPQARSVVGKSGKLTQGGHVDSINLTPDQLIELYLQSQDPFVRQQLVTDSPIVVKRGRADVRHIIREGDMGSLVQLTLEDLKAIGNALTPAEKRFAEGVLKVNREITNDINKHWRNTRGYDFVQTKDPYMPIRRSMEYSDRVPEVPPDVVEQFYNQRLDRQGHFQERTGGRQPIIVEGVLAAMDNYIDQASRLIALEKATNDAVAVVRNPAVKERMATRVAGGEKLLKSLEDDILSTRKPESITASELERGGQKILGRTTSAYITGSPINIPLLNYASYLNALAEIEPKYWARGAKRFMSFVSKEEAQWWMDRSPLLKERALSSGRMRVSPVEEPRAAWDRYMGTQTKGWGMQIVQNPDMHTAFSIGRAVKKKGEALGWSEKKIVAEAERVVNRTQNTWGAMERSAMARKAPGSLAMRTATMLQSQQNQQWDMVARAIMKFKAEGGFDTNVPGFKGRMKTFVLQAGLPTIVNSILVTGIRRGSTLGIQALMGMAGAGAGLTPPKKRKPYGAVDYGIDILQNMVSNDMLVGRAVSEVMQFGKQVKAGIPIGQADMFTVPVLNELTKAAQGVAYLAEAVDEKSGKDFMKGIERLMQAASVTGVPTQGIARFLRPTGIFGSYGDKPILPKLGGSGGGVRLGGGGGGIRLGQ